MAVMRVEKNSNYTVMANYHLRDKRLSLKAKGLLSVMISLPAEWDYMSIVLKRAIVDIRCPYEVSRSRLLGIISDEMETAVREIDGITGKADIMNICAFEPDAMIIRIAVECHVKDHWRIEREIRARIKDRFDAEGIIMPHYSGHDFRYISYEN